MNHAPSSGQSDNKSADQEKGQRRAFKRELGAMMRLRSPYTVLLYGAVTSQSDRLILVMGLMPGGDLRSFLRDAGGPVEEGRPPYRGGRVCRYALSP